ncbi:MAG TPA: FHA domain-containing protein [Thermoanaerobaculia bacterium]|nr:FHA domain-containing protein [Thermoanaerobaculia bacterium]
MSPSSGEASMEERAKKLVGGLKELKDRVIGPWRKGSSLLEIQRSIVDDVCAHVAEIGSGRRVFPYHRIEVDLRFTSDEERAIGAAALDAGWGEELRERIEARLAESRCVPTHLDVVVGVLDEPAQPEGPYHAIRLERADPGAAERAPAPSTRPTLVLEIQRGAAEEDVYRLDQDRVLIGRLRDVLDRHGRIKRRNHVAFLDEGEDNQTVSREHARILYRESPRGYWLSDERSAYGTRIFRDGRPIDVSSRDRRGVRLKDGDEIYLGRTVLRCGLLERAGDEARREQAADDEAG